MLPIHLKKGFTVSETANTAKPTNSATVALYGLGNMGYPLAQLLSQRFDLRVSDPNAAQVKRACEELGAKPLDPTQDLGHIKTVVLCLPDPAISRQIVQAIAPNLAPGAVIVETSTVNPDDIHACLGIAQQHGVDLIDASIMAGVAQMAAGQGTLAVGGSEAAIQCAGPVLEAISAKQIFFGAPGTGAAAKVINNAVAHAVMVVVAEAGSMATAAGVSIDKLIGLLSDSKMGLHRPLTYRYAERIVNGDYEGGMPLDAARKDSVLALQLAQKLGVPLFATLSSHAVYEMAAAAGYGREDYAAIAKLWADWGKPTVPDA